MKSDAGEWIQAAATGLLGCLALKALEQAALAGQSEQGIT